MKIQARDLRGRPIELACSQVLILADDGATPLGVALDLGPGVTIVSHADEPSFARVLESLGVSRVRVERGEAPSVGQFSFSAPRN